MKKLEVIIRHSRLGAVRDGLLSLGVRGMSISDIKGFGRQGGHTEVYRGNEIQVDFVPKVKMEIVLKAELVSQAIEVIRQHACTGQVGDGKIFILPVENVIRIRTDERGVEAI
jgi:nitrogen regulatory protein P-II 1